MGLVGLFYGVFGALVGFCAGFPIWEAADHDVIHRLSCLNTVLADASGQELIAAAYKDDRQEQKRYDGKSLLHSRTIRTFSRIATLGQIDRFLA